ncbi:mucin-binding protein, partial [Collinsella sp. Sow4_E3]|uniref:mucin-binding protein n=1 Tax=Collinsella sp. Sow4_E3 TaxID=3438776 RepID=UPI003F8FA43E
MRKIIGKKNKVHYVEETTRYKMVKSHKGWLVIGTSMFALGLGVLVTSQPVSADVVATSTSSSAVRAETTSANNSSAVNAETTSASSSSAVNAETTSANNSSAVNAEMTGASSSSAVNAETTSASSSSAVNAETTSASSSSAVNADTTSGNLTAATVNSTSDTKSAVSSAATVASSSSATKADSANATSTNEYSASGNDTTSTDANGSSTKNRTAAVNSAKSLNTSSSLPSQISDFTVSVTASDGSTMNNGSSFNLSGQSAHLKAINLGFTLTQDGTLTPGSTIKIPVSVTNNSSDLVGSALSSGTSLDIQNVGTIKYQMDGRYGTSGSYIITIGDSFDPTSGKKVIATVTEQPGETSSLVTTNSNQNIVLTIGDNTFTFVPVKRIYEKDTGDYRSSDFAYGPTASQINTGTMITDPNYLNNALSGAKNTPADTSIPTGNIINIERVTTGGSVITQVNLGKYIGSGTLKISEDGTYLIKNDNSVGKDFGQGSGVTSLITLPAGTSDDDILAALNKAGKHSGVVINEGNGQYTIAYNLGKVVGDGAYTFHDLYPNDDAATQADAAQEVNRTDDVNSELNKKLATLYAFQSMGIQSEFRFADSSIKNTLQGTGTQYSVASDGTVTKVTSNNISSNTTPSNARSEGQFKVTVHYVDKDGKELATQAYSYGYPAGSSIATQSPDYQVAPKDIKGYTLVTSDSPVSSLNGKQLTTSEAVPFLANDQTVYYVYTKNAPTITTEKKTVNETVSYVDQNGHEVANKHTASVDFTRQVSTDAVTGEKTYGNWSADQSFDAVKSPELKGYTADKAQIDKQTVNGDSKDLEFTVTYTKNAP